MKEEVVSIIKDVIYNERKLTEDEIKLVLSESGDYVEDIEKDPTFVRVELPATNVGPSYVPKEFEEIVIRVDNFATKLYYYGDEHYDEEHNEELGYGLAGYEYFSTIAEAIGMKFMSADWFEEDDE